MKYKGPMLVVKNMERSKEFYTQILGVRIISDLGENITFTGGLSLQTEKSWMEFTNCSSGFFKYQGNVVEMYFEEENFDLFLEKINSCDVEVVGERNAIMPWGQRIIRFYDPDKHIIEVGEEIKSMVKRFHDEGMTIAEIMEKTQMKKGIIERIINSAK